MKKIAVVLAGCGVFDGAEIHEAVMTLYAIQKNHASFEIFAPDMDQMHVINHLTGQVMPEKRNVLIEAARIARKNIRPLDQLKPDQFDAIILPGGFGVAKNLCSFATGGASMTVLPLLERILRDFHKQNKPIGALCISPVILAKLFPGAKVTIGKDPGTIKHVETMGARHQITSHGEVALDEENLIFSTPCYMLDANIVQIAEGAEHIVQAMLKKM